MKKKTVFMATCLFALAAAFAQTINDSIRYDLMLTDVVVKSSLPKEKNITGGKSTRIVGTTLSKVGTAKQVIGHLSGVYQKKDGSIEVTGKGTPIIRMTFSSTSSSWLATKRCRSTSLQTTLRATR